MRSTILFFFLLFPALAQAPSDTKPQKVKLNIGQGEAEVVKLDFTPSDKIQVSNPGVLNYELVPAKREIVFKGKAAGSSNVILRDGVGDIRKIYEIKITTSKLSKTVQELKELIGDVEGLTIGIKGGRVYLGGKIIVPKDITKIFTAVQNRKDIHIDFDLSPQSKQIVARKMQEKMESVGLPDVTVNIVNDIFWLEGVVKSDAEKILAETVLKAFLPDKIDISGRDGTGEYLKYQKPDYINSIVVNVKKETPPLPKLVKITVQFIELTKDYGKIFGFSWNPLIGGDDQGSITIGRGGSGGLTTRSSGTLSGIITNLFPKLRTAKQAGYAQVWQSAVVYSKVDESSSIEKSYSIPYAIGTGDGQTTAQTDIGFKLQVTPKLLQEENIELSIGLSVKVLTGKSSDGNPLSTSNNLQTILMTKSGQSAVVGGIAINEQQTAYDKEPIANPVVDTSTGSSLFNFGRSRSKLSNKSQFVVFITPQLIDSPSQDVKKIKKKFKFRRMR